MFRAHYDSHLFTIVLSMKIPTPMHSGTVWDLIYLSNARKRPRNEIVNFIAKAALTKECVN
jgi:hypothetical protein